RGQLSAAWALDRTRSPPERRHAAGLRTLGVSVGAFTVGEGPGHAGRAAVRLAHRSFPDDPADHAELDQSRIRHHLSRRAGVRLQDGASASRSRRPGGAGRGWTVAAVWL